MGVDLVWKFEEVENGGYRREDYSEDEVGDRDILPPLEDPVEGHGGDDA